MPIKRHNPLQRKELGIEKHDDPTDHDPVQTIQLTSERLTAGDGAARTLGVNVKSLELEDDDDGKDDGRGLISRDTGQIAMTN